MLCQALCSISKPSVNKNWSYCPETLNSGQNLRFLFVPCELEIWRISLKINRAPLLCYFKLYVSFHSHRSIQTGVKVRKYPIRVKIEDFFVLCGLEIWQMTLKNNRAPLPYYFKFMYHFIAIGQFKLELQSGNAQFKSKSTIVCPVQPWNLTDDFEKQ